jgi:signal transduction histidine kinase
VDVQIDGDVDALPEEHRTCVFRVVQEALNNCERHAKAKSIRIVAYGREDWVHLTIEDDGAGFNVGAPRTGLGLIGIEERVRDLDGKLRVASKPGRGTLIDIELPVKTRVAL